MTLKIRIIPCLDVDRGRVVKGVNFFDLRRRRRSRRGGHGIRAAGADELVFYDITASHEGRDIMASTSSPHGVEASCRLPSAAAYAPPTIFAISSMRAQKALDQYCRRAPPPVLAEVADKFGA